MRLWHASRIASPPPPPPRLPLLSLLVTLLAAAAFTRSAFASAKNAGPRITKTAFEHRFDGLSYFEGSDVVLAYDPKFGVVHRSTDAGEDWKTVEDIPKGQVAELRQNPFDRNKAYVLSTGHRHWRTDDRGETWHPFKTSASPSPRRSTLNFHAGDTDKVIFMAEECQNLLFDCDEVALYTTDGFATDPKSLRTGVRGCTWARSSDLFGTGHEFSDADRVLCIAKGAYSRHSKDNRLVMSDNYFVDEVEPELGPGRTIHGLVNMATVKKYMVAAVKADRTDEMALYVTDDTNTWHRAVFQGDHKVEEDAYTILESTNYSIQVDVMSSKPWAPLGVLFTSNSNGTYFTPNAEHTNRNRRGLVDFEKVQGIQGIVMVNVVDNWKEVEASASARKKVRSQISFDDGRTFRPLKVGDEHLHLHSVSDSPEDGGRVFSSPAPGIVMGVGNTGDHLDKYSKGDLYFSDDAGLTWSRTREGPHRYAFGDQGAVLVAVADAGLTREMAYSIDHGKHWKTADLGDDVRASHLVTTPDSTSLKFLLLGVRKEGDERHLAYSVDFDGLHERKCGEGDFERWCARLDGKGEPGCLMGHKQFFRRRKPDADCFVDEEFKNPQPEFEPCACADEDFECDYNFVREGDGCVQAGALVVPDGACKGGEEGSFVGSPGYRLIPGNACRRDEGGVRKDEPVEHRCSGSAKPPADGKVATEATRFKGNAFSEYFYLERTDSSQGDDETIVMRTDGRQVFITHDHGKTWAEILKGKKIESIYPHEHINDAVFFVTDGVEVFYSYDRGKTIDSFKAPREPTSLKLQVMGFHPTRKDWIMWTGSKPCDRPKEDCHANVYISIDRGDNWNTMLRHVRKCRFAGGEGLGDARASTKRVFCQQIEKEGADEARRLVASDDFFVEDRKVHFKDHINFAIMSEFIIVAAMAADPGRDSLKIDASLDGETFADARFPPNFNVPHQQAYTVLDSSTHAVFLHVTVNTLRGHEFGSILKSNSNGTSYVLSLGQVNRDVDGYVDFEKMLSLEGVSVVNVVANADAAKGGGESKKLKTMISHNDGAEWSLLPRPAQDADGKAFGCDGDVEACSLHLHGYTERINPKNTYSSPTAIGLMMGVGNVGAQLESAAKADTFISRDGGVGWEAVKKGRYLWGFGDQGGIIVIVRHATPTTTVSFSLDEGRTWREHQFGEKKMRVSEISTVPRDNSRNFLLWGQFEGEDKQISTVNLDFGRLHERKCELDETDPEAGDYYLWTPKHPRQDDDCLFGHVAQYHRKKIDSNCFTGHLELPTPHVIVRNCSCTRQDFECDYNFERQRDGSCALVPGLTPPDHSKICQDNPDVVEYHEPTGYRRIPLTTCQGGRELEYVEDKARPCPKHEDEFDRSHDRTLSGAGVFFAIVVPIGLASAAGYWVWRNWDGKFGRIRLGDGSGSSGGGGAGGGGGASMVWDAERAWIKYPIMAVAVVVAVLIAVPDTTTRLWRSTRTRFGMGGTSRSSGGASRRYTTRDSFARRQGDYDAVVDTDEGELLGDESDEEV